MIKIINGYFSYDNKNDILKNINIEIKEKEKLAFIGANGAGKSTLIDILIGNKKLRKGKIEFNSKTSINESMGVQFQTKDFPIGLKVKHLLQFYLDMNKISIQSKEVINLLKKFDLSDKLNVELKRLSGGQQQKFNIMVTLINKPKILILDELITGLDITSQNTIIDLLEKTLKENKDMTLIIVSHNHAELDRLVDRVVVFNKGQIVEDLKKTNIVKKYKSVENYIGGLHE